MSTRLQWWLCGLMWLAACGGEQLSVGELPCEGAKTRCVVHRGIALDPRIVPSSSSPEGTATVGQVVLIELAERRAALIVDEFIGQQEIVMKQFDGVNGSRTLFSGATILGDGAPALIIDASTLL